MPKCQFLFSAVFGFRNPSNKIFSELDEINAQVPIFTGSIQNTRESSEGGHRVTRRVPGAARGGAAPPYSLGPPEVHRPCPSAYLKPPSRSQDLGDRSLCSGTLPEQGSAPGRLLHRHHRHLHQRCCLP